MENETRSAGSQKAGDVIPDYYKGVALNFMTVIPEKMKDKSDKQRKAPGVIAANGFFDIVQILESETMNLALRDYDEKDYDKKEKEEEREEENEK